MSRLCPSRLSAALALLALLGGGCSAERAPDQQLPLERATVDHAQARELITLNGCGTCHVVPGVTGADGTVGPPLVEMREQVYIAGVVTNTEANLVRWLLEPAAVDPRTAMPDVGLTRSEAELIARYLYEVGEDE